MVRGAFPENLHCPSCERGWLAPHGSYRRRVDGQLMWIRRARCRSCGVTHAVLPEDVCAYRDLSLDVLTVVLTASRPMKAARALGDTSPAAVRRIRRCRLEARGERARSAERLLPEARAPAPWWQRAIEVFGDLASWRRWQWRVTGHFATPMLGPFRHGALPGRSPSIQHRLVVPRGRRSLQARSDREFTPLTTLESPWTKTYESALRSSATE